MIGTIMAKRAIVGAFDALTRQDLDKFMADWRDDAVFVFPGDVPASGTFEGKPDIRAWFRQYFEQFPKTAYEIKHVCVRNSFDLTGNNVLAVEWHLQLTNRQGRASENAGVTVITIQGGKVVKVKDYYFDTGSGFRRDWGAA